MTQLWSGIEMTVHVMNLVILLKMGRESAPVKSEFS